ncbi:hypothetical protein [Microbacterium enclense]|uniref:hypothetical protein n=1 Tax=Microbacterium enclense TaxID=993073 RepID=UPI0034477FED
MANVISLRGILALGLAVLAVLAGATAVRRRRWGVSAALAVALAAGSLGHVGVLIARGWISSSSHGTPTAGAHRRMPSLDSCARPTPTSSVTP